MQGAASDDTTHWWQRRAAVVALIAFSVVPLLWPTVPPLVDLPGHMGRYAIQLGIGDVPQFRQWYSFRWALIGNLGVDLLIIPMATLFGIELGTKLIVIATIALTAAGLLWIAREVHGRIPPTALFALPFAYGHPFQFGFINFALAMALGLCAFALWLRMARLGAERVRPIVFLPISILLWVCHTYGWGLVGILAFSAEVVRQWDMRQLRGRRWWAVPAYAAWHCLPMAAPIAMMVIWRSGAVAGVTADWFNWSWKLVWLTQTLRDRWWALDSAALAIAVAVLVTAALSRRLGYSRNLGASALVVLIMFLAIPRIVFGSAYADMRLTPYLFAIALVAIRPTARAERRFVAALAVAGLAFFGARTVLTTVSFIAAAKRVDRSLVALNHVPVGARLVTFVGSACSRAWPMTRDWHLPGLALVRRQAFSNDQWNLPGAQLLRVRIAGAGRFGHDPSQVVSEHGCRRDGFWSLPVAMARLPRGAFDYIWLINPPPFSSAIMAGTTRVWTDGDNALFRINPIATLAVAGQRR